MKVFSDTKCCTKCGETNKLFPVNRRLKGGLDSWCCECRNKTRRVMNLPLHQINALRRRARERHAGRVVACEHCGSIIRGPVPQGVE